jgi:hypothetical protein
MGLGGWRLGCRRRKVVRIVLPQSKPREGKKRKHGTGLNKAAEAGRGHCHEIGSSNDVLGSGQRLIARQ